MLAEVKQQRANGGPPRRWYRSEDADLYIWGRDDRPAAAFEYCYRFRGAEYSLRWDNRSGFEFGGIDDGETTPLKNDTPIRVHDGRPPWGLIARHFRYQGRALEPALFDFILGRLIDAARSSA